MQNNKFSWQSLISLGLLFSFIIVFVSGFILYIAPEGSLSRWIGWDVFHLTKKQWEHQHTIFSYLFIVFSIFHIFTINWDLLLSYFIPEKLHLSNFRELTIAITITILVFIGTLTNLNPFKFIIDLGNKISDKYAEQVEIPKVLEAEKLSMSDFADQVFHITFFEMKEILDKLDFQDLQKDVIVGEYCIENDITPEELYKILKGQLMNMDEEGAGLPDISSISSFINNNDGLL